MANAHDHLPTPREDDHPADRSPAARGQAGSDEKPDLRQQLADGRWPLFALEVLVLLVIFGWMAITNVLAGGHGPL